MEQQTDADKQDSGIKMYLKKRYYEIQEQIQKFEEQISDLRRALNKAIANDNEEEIKQIRIKKQDKEKELGEYEQNELGGHLKQFLKEFTESDTKWIIQCFYNKIDAFTKDKLIQIADELNLQKKIDTHLMSIARQGKPIDELIKMAINEEKKKSQNKQQLSNKKQNNEQSNGQRQKVEQLNNNNSNQQQKSNKMLSQINKEQENSEQQTEFNDQQQNANETAINQQNTSKQNKNLTNNNKSNFQEINNTKQNVEQLNSANSNSEQPKDIKLNEKQNSIVQSTIEQADQNQQQIQNENLASKSPNKQSSNPQQQSNSKIANGEMQQTELQNQIEKPTKEKTDQNNQNQKKQNEKIEKTNEQQQNTNESQISTNKKEENKNKDKKNERNKSDNNDKKKEEQLKDEDFYSKVLEQSLKQKQQGTQVQEILEEVEEEQKNMTKNEIVESLGLAPDSVKGYEVLSMSDDYVLKIRAFVPDYKVYLMKKKKFDLTQESLKEQALLDGVSISHQKEFLTESNSNEIEIDLKSTVFSNYTQSVNNELQFTLFSITACSKNQNEILESQIQYIFILNIPKIILENTKLLLSGSCTLISQKFFKNQDTFNEQYDEELSAVRNFISPDNDLFQQFQIMQVNLGKSVLLLLKSGQVIQWGQVICFFENKNEFSLEEILSESEDKCGDVLVQEPFMPVSHPLVFTRIAQGESHYVGVTIDGKVYSWGLNIYGQLGHQNQTSYAEPKRIDFLSNEKIFIVDVKCGDNFTVCQSIDGSLYTFGQYQALEGKDIIDSYGNVLNYCNEGVNQYAPRKVYIRQKVSQFECGPQHCILLTDKNECFLWGDNHYMQVCQDKNFHTVSNFASPIPVLMTFGEDYIFKKVFCNLSHNSAILQSKDSGEQIYVKWGGETTSLNVKICKQKFKLPQQDEEEYDIKQTKKNQNKAYLKNYDNFKTNLYSNLLIINNDTSKLYANGLNNTFELGVKTSKIIDFEQVPLPQCRIIQACLGDIGTGALLVI